MKIGRATIHNMDCQAFLEKCQDNQFDLAIVDPPYGLPNRSTKGMGKLADRVVQGMHKKGWDIAPNRKYFDQLFRVSKNQIIWGGNYFDLPPCRGFIVWDKKQPWPNFAACEYAWNSIDGVAKLFKYDNRQDTKQHPTQKPVALYEWLLANYAKPGDSILDTHMGSGSIAIATNKHGFDLTACELDTDYFTAACERIRNAYNQPDMFTPQEAKPEQVELI